MNQYFYMPADGSATTPLGPYTAGQMAGLHLKGHLDESTLVVRGGEQSWQPFGLLREAVHDQAKAEAAASAQIAALAATPACPMCHQQNWKTVSEGHGGYQLTGISVLFIFGAPAGCAVAGSALISGQFAAVLGLGFLAIVILLLCQTRKFRQCRSCKYRYQTK